MPIFQDIPYISQENNESWNKTIPNDNVNIINHLYEDSPNVFIQKYNEIYFNCNWCFNITAEADFNIGKLYQSPNDFQNISKVATKFNNHWVNNIYYDNVDQDSHWSVVSIFQQTHNINENILVDYNIPFIKLSYNKLSMYAIISPVTSTGDTVLILYACGYDGNIGDRTNLTFVSVTEMLSHNDISGGDDISTILRKLNDSLSSVKLPGILKFDKSLFILPSQSPNIMSRENEYYKNDNINTSLYVIRYSGNITPTFTDVNDTPNYLYVKDRITDESFKGSKYFPYIRSGYVPVFPSLQYTSLVGYTLDYQTPPNIVNDNEYSWFNSGVSLILQPELSLNVVVKANENTWDVINNAINKYIKEIYDLSDDKQVKYIYNLYDLNYDYNYKDPYNMPNIGEGVNSKYDYIYNITMTLK